MNKKWNRITAGLLVAALTFANSMTVFAYRDVLHVEVAETASEDEIETHLGKDTFIFVFDEVEEEKAQEFEVLEELEELELRYDRQFTDEKGHVYPISADNSVEPYCNHTFGSGTATEHGKTSGGGCIVTQYRAQRCTKCGYVILGEEINEITYKVCPH